MQSNSESRHCNPSQTTKALLRISKKKLRRLPHVFSRVWELPFRSDADMAVEKAHDCFCFMADTERIGVVRTHMVKIHPGDCGKGWWSVGIVAWSIRAWYVEISVIEFDVVGACWCGGYGVDFYEVKGHHMQNVEAVIGMMVDLWLYGNCVATMMLKF